MQARPTREGADMRGGQACRVLPWHGGRLAAMARLATTATRGLLQELPRTLVSLVSQYAKWWRPGGPGGYTTAKGQSSTSEHPLKKVLWKSIVGNKILTKEKENILERKESNRLFHFQKKSVVIVLI